MVCFSKVDGFLFHGVKVTEMISGSFHSFIPLEKGVTLRQTLKTFSACSAAQNCPCTPVYMVLCCTKS